MQRMASAVNFKVHLEQPNQLLRRGSLHFAKKNKTIQTPACIAYTIRGSVPHLVTDNLKLTPVELAQVSLEHFVEEKEPSSFKYPHGLHKYLHLEDYLLFCDMRDPLKSVPISFNTDKYLSVDTHGGVRQVTPDVWAQAMEAYQPDLCASMCDFVTDEDAKLKRIKRSVDRTLRWLDTCKSKADSLEIPLFAPVVGSDSAEERKRSAIETAQRDVQGFILNVFGLKNEDLESLIRASVDQLPASKPRLAYGLATPENILRGVANGIDLFDGSYAYKVTQRGHAITFKFGDQLTESSKDKQAKTLSLWRTELNRSFEPLDASCGCYSCTAPHTKAYIHHLLNAHEMLGPLLLMSHNLHQLHEFMASIRRSIEGNRFDQDVEAFLKHYEQDKDAKKDEEHSDEIDAESLGVPLKKKRTLLL